MQNIARKNNHGCDVYFRWFYGCVQACRDANALASKQTLWPAVIGLRKYLF